MLANNPPPSILVSIYTPLLRADCKEMRVVDYTTYYHACYDWSFEKRKFYNCTFLDCRLYGCTCIGCTFVNCNLIKTVTRKSTISESECLECTFRYCDAYHTKTIRGYARSTRFNDACDIFDLNYTGEDKNRNNCLSLDCTVSVTLKSGVVHSMKKSEVAECLLKKSEIDECLLKKNEIE